MLAFTACNNANNTPANNTPQAPAEPVHSKLSDAGTAELMTMVTRYYALKNALVATKASRADSAATDLANTAAQIQITLQKDSANSTALQPFMDTIVTHSKLVNTLKDETCEQQRIVFEVISRNMYALLKNVELKNAKIYHQYCPMAFNDKGAYWLSGESDILNPYFGKKMLECGEVTDSI